MFCCLLRQGFEPFAPPRNAEHRMSNPSELACGL
jgi:hypothetical protein